MFFLSFINTYCGFKKRAAWRMRLGGGLFKAAVPVLSGLAGSRLPIKAFAPAKMFKMSSIHGCIGLLTWARQ